jgi:hypothetical protein
MDRAFILHEIIRTAKANGGKPLGWRKSQSETGIKYSDWHGKHWVRWNDAIREAGLVPRIRPFLQDRKKQGAWTQRVRTGDTASRRSYDCPRHPNRRSEWNRGVPAQAFRGKAAEGRVLFTSTQQTSPHSSDANSCRSKPRTPIPNAGYARNPRDWGLERHDTTP